MASIFRNFAAFGCLVLSVACSARNHKHMQDPNGYVNRILSNAPINFPSEEKFAAIAEEPVAWQNNHGLAYEDGAALTGTVSKPRADEIADSKAFKSVTWVHIVRDSLGYAEALLATGKPDDQARAIRVIQAVLKKQCVDPNNERYGLWPYVNEDDVEKMQHPDPNIAELTAIPLLSCIVEFEKRLPADLVHQMDLGVLRAIVYMRDRDTGPKYNNIAVADTALMVTAAARYNDGDLWQRATKRLDSLYNILITQNDFSEYNSPAYVMMVIHQLGLARRAVLPDDLKQKVNAINDRIWLYVSDHYHAPSGQWGGPYSRHYVDLMALPDIAYLSLCLSVPPEHPNGIPESDRHYFTDMKPNRSVVQTFIQPDPGESETLEPTYLGGILPIVGTTYLQPTYVLGSVSAADFWSQRAPLIMHWGSKEHPSFARLHVLCDGNDLADVMYFGRQDKGHAMAGCVLATDGGLVHPQILLQNNILPAADIRVRFEFGGSAGAGALTAPQHVSDPILINDSGVSIALSVPYAAFGKFQPTWEVSKVGPSNCLDLVLYHGAKTDFDLTQIGQAGFAVLWNSSEATIQASATPVEYGLSLKWGDLNLTFPTGPMTRVGLFHWVKSHN